jgi:hypothetical protein
MAGVTFNRALTAQQAHDLLQITAEHYPAEKSSIEVITANTQFHVVNRWWKNKVIMSSGTEWNDTVYFDRDGNTHFLRLRPGQPINRSINKRTAKYHIPLVKAGTYWTIMHDEVARNRDPDKLKDITLVRKLESQLNMAVGLEGDGFGTPDSAADDLKPYGLQYWIKPITTTQSALDTQGFQGSRPLYSDLTTEATSCANIDPDAADYDLYRNWNARWAHDDILNDFDATDVFRVIKMLRNLEFEVPVIVDDWKAGKFSNYEIGVPEALLETMEIYAQQNNDNLQADLGKFSGQVVMKGTPVHWMKKLDTDWHQATTTTASNPLVLINHDHFHPIVFEGENFRDDEPLRDADTPDVWTNYTFLVYNYVMTNRRLGGAVISVEPIA